VAIPESSCGEYQAKGSIGDHPAKTDPEERKNGSRILARAIFLALGKVIATVNHNQDSDEVLTQPLKAQLSQ
jgi:hypothetical protein